MSDVVNVVDTPTKATSNPAVPVSANISNTRDQAGFVDSDKEDGYESGGREKSDEDEEESSESEPSVVSICREVSSDSQHRRRRTPAPMRKKRLRVVSHLT